MARILVVEDDQAIRDLVLRVLRTDGHTLHEAVSGDEALTKLAQDAYDLVILDLMLGAVSGWDVLEEANRRGVRSKFKVLMLTARSSERDFLQGWRNGVDQYLTKPFDVEVLRDTVEDTLRTPSEQLAERRKSELEKTELLYRLESAFERW